MQERPIIFSTPMVQAVIAGDKTQTRRVVKNPGYGEKTWLAAVPHFGEDAGASQIAHLRVAFDEETERAGKRIKCPYGAPGDRLWIRETWQRDDRDGKTAYRASPETTPKEWVNWHWRSPLFMPRLASRLTLEVLETRVEKLQSMPWQDALAEGIEPVECDHAYADPRLGCTDCMGTGLLEDPRGGFADLWDKINGARGYPWDSNPWVWVVRFTRIESDDGTHAAKRK
jgi:hypothetical protein